MKMIIPITVTNAIFTSSTAPVDSNDEWATLTPYITGDIVKVSDDGVHRTYEALQNSNSDYPPDSPTYWLDLGPTNRWAMFDSKVGSQTTATTTMTVELTPGIVTGLGLIGLSNVTDIEVTMTDPTEGVVYTETIDIYDTTPIVDWWTYFFEDITLRDTQIIEGLPTYSGATIEVIISGGTGDTIGVGGLIVGKLREWASSAEYGASFGIQDYSVKSIDDFGNYQITERAFAKRAALNLLIDNIDLDLFHKTLTALRATPAVYIAASDFDTAVIYGFYRDYSTVISYPTKTEVSIEIEGLT